MTDIEILTSDPFGHIRSPHVRNAYKLRDNPEYHGKWCILRRYQNSNSPAHQAWRLSTEVFGPEGSRPDPHFEFCSKWYDQPDGTKVYCLLGKYQP